MIVIVFINIRMMQKMIHDFAKDYYSVEKIF